MNDARLQLAFGGLHPDRVRGLYEKHGPLGTLRRLEKGAIETTDRVRQAVAVPAEVRREELAASGIDLVFRGDPIYPDRLADLPDAPDLLFVRGVLPVEPAVGVVGTRRCTSYGKRIAEGYGRAIAAAGWPLVSGLARGIDGAAHRGTVAAGGVGVAVLGSGIDVMYPREHADLARELIDRGGAVISESPPGTPPESWRFPPRNLTNLSLEDCGKAVMRSRVSSLRMGVRRRRFFATRRSARRSLHLPTSMRLGFVTPRLRDPDGRSARRPLSMHTPLAGNIGTARRDHPVGYLYTDPEPPVTFDDDGRHAAGHRTGSCVSQPRIRRARTGRPGSSRPQRPFRR
jgi:hypothetical protein